MKRFFFFSLFEVSFALVNDCNVQQDISFNGFDIAYNVTASGDYKSCLSQCITTPLCSAFTLLPSGRCFLKSNATNATSFLGALSCANVANIPSQCPLSLTPCSLDTSSAGACSLYKEVCINAPNCPSGSVLCPDETCIPSGSGWQNCPTGSLPTYLDTTLSLEERVESIVSNLSLEEIAFQLNNQGYGSGPPGPPGIERLSMPPYNWLNEGLHGVARSGLATSFPQISVVGNSFNRTSWWWLGRILGVEARAKHIMYARQNATNADYTGVTFYAPNINLGRDARWGRIQEIPTEDPFVMSEYAKSVVLGAQANEDLSIQPPKWLVDRSIRGTNAGRNFARSSKTATSSTGTSAIIACCKHAIAYSVEEVDGIPRAKFNAIVSGADLLDSYMPAFQGCFMEGGGRSSMCSYNSVNNVPTCASAFLLNTTIRQRYGRGDDTFIMSDYSAIMDTWASHKYCETAAECIAKTLINGVDQDGGGNDYDILPLLVTNSTAGLTEANVRAAATRLFRARVSLGILDPPQSQPWLDLDIPSVLDTEFHRNMSLDAATQGIVLLTNKNSTLPLSFESIRKIAVIGPNADVPNTLYGNYQGTPPFLVTPKMGLITALGDTSRVYYAAGCADVNCNDTSGFPDAIAAASQKDVDAVVLVLGIDQTIEREGTDRINLTLPGLQINLAQAVCSAAFTRSVPCIIVYINGGPISESWPVTSPLVSSLLLLGYASQSAGTALANILFGLSSPAGKLAVTWPNSVNDLPPMGDMNMRPNKTSGTFGRTYRFSTRSPLFSFGYGLTYSNWSYTDLQLPSTPVSPCAGVPISFILHNIGLKDSEQVVQVYISFYPNPPSGASAPSLISLVEFDRVFVSAGNSMTINFTITPQAISLVNASTATLFGQDFAMSGNKLQFDALSGAAFGVDRNYHAEALATGKGNIGWDDMFFIPTGVSVTIWVGSSQPGQIGPGTEGIGGSFSIEGLIGEGVNLATCDLE